MLADPYLVTTNESYFSKSTGRNKTGVLAVKFIVPKNLWGTSGTCKHGKHLSGATNEFSLLFGAVKHCFANDRTDESKTVNETKYASI